MEPTQREKEDAIIAIMLMELELNRGGSGDDIEIVRRNLSDINEVLKKNKNENRN